jgi:hypothetical protein
VLLQVYYFILILLAKTYIYRAVTYGDEDNGVSGRAVEFIGAYTGLRQCQDDFQNIKNSNLDLYNARVKQCVEEQSVLRASFSAFCALAVVACVAIFGGSAYALHQCWGLKVFLPPIAIIVSVFMPNAFFDWLAYISAPIAGFFLIVQMILFLDLGYSWNAVWVHNALEDQQREEKSGKAWFVALILFSIFFTVLSLVASIVMQGWANSFYYHTGAVTAVIWISFALSLLFALISLMEWCKHGAWLPSSLMMSYFAYMVYFTIQCDYVPKEINDGSQILEGAATTNMTQLVIGMFLMVLSLGIYLRNPNILSLSNGEILATDGQSFDSIGGGSGGDSNKEGDVENARSSDDDEKKEDLPPADYWQTLLFLAVHIGGALYLNRLMLSSHGPWFFWVYAVSNWIAVALFGFSILAPQFLDRDFEHE